MSNNTSHLDSSQDQALQHGQSTRRSLSQKPPEEVPDSSDNDEGDDIYYQARMRRFRRDAHANPPRMSHYLSFSLSLSSLFFSLCASIAVLSITAGLVSMPTYLYLHEHK